MVMRTRHRIPMIFTLSMMDVFCCTLGCVILLWLINQREAMMRTRAANESAAQLTTTRATLAATEQKGSDLARLIDDLDKQLAAARADLKKRGQELATSKDDLAAARTRIDALTNQLATARERAADNEDRLAKKAEAERQLLRQREEAK